MIKKICFFLLFIFSIYAKAQKLIDEPPIKPDERQIIVTKFVAEMMSNANYKTIPLNDSLSALVFNRYLEALDPGHNYFFKSDLKSIEPFRTVLDDDIKNGNLDHVFQIFDLFQLRYREKINYSIEALKKDFNFESVESLSLDRSKLPYPNDAVEMQSIWDKRVKYDLLVLSKTSKDIKANKAVLTKRYNNLISQSAQLTNQDVFQVFMDAVTHSVDPHAAYYNPSNAAQFNLSMSRSLEGIGATLALENGYVTIKSLTAGGPASKTRMIDLQDRIIAIADGKDGEFTDIVGWRIDHAVALIRGKKGSIVRLKLLAKSKNETDQPKVVSVIREKIIMEDQSAKKEIREYNADGKKIKIGIINIPQFYFDYRAFNAGDKNYKSTTKDVALLLDTLKKMKVDGVIIDLRQNGGGSLSEAIDLTGLFIKTGPVVQVRDVKNNVQINRDENPLVTFSGPLGVLVDRFSASASEIFAAAIQDYGRGLIIGTQTYGKGTVQRQIDLDQVIKFSSLKDQAAAIALKKSSNTQQNQSIFGQFNLTIGKFYRINGSSTQHLGVSPDVVFPSLYPMDEYGEDSEESALDWDTIGKASYVQIGSFQELLPSLNKLHDNRFELNKLNIYSNETKSDFKKSSVLTQVSLNAQENKMESDRRESHLLFRNNLLRKAMGYNELKKGDSGAKNQDLDFVKKEAGQVLTDYIMLNSVN